MAELPPGFTRRGFLAAATGTAGALLLGACGGGDDTVDSGDGADEGSDGGDAGGGGIGTSSLVMVPFVGEAVFGVGIPNRVPFGVADSTSLLKVEDTPEEIEVTVLGPDGKAIGDPVTVRRHADGLERAYFPLEVTTDEPGIFAARAELVEGEAASEMNFAVNTLDELTTLLKPGDPFPAIATPTVADALGVDPLCTADPVCALHDVTVAEALASKAPMAVLIATPAFCKVSACGPVHHVLLDVLADHPSVKALHLEVYAHPFENLDDYAPVLRDLRLVFEPVLFLIGSDGLITTRLDAIYDRAELDEALSSLS